MKGHEDSATFMDQQGKCGKIIAIAESGRWVYGFIHSLRGSFNFSGSLRILKIKGWQEGGVVHTCDRSLTRLPDPHFLALEVVLSSQGQGHPTDQCRAELPLGLPLGVPISFPPWVPSLETGWDEPGSWDGWVGLHMGLKLTACRSL